MGMQQILLTSSKITTESARILGNNVVLAKSVNRDYDSEFGVTPKAGQSISVRLPYRPHGRVGAIIDPNAVQEVFVPLTFGQPIGVDYTFSSTEMALSIDDFSNRFIKPAMVRLANDIDLAGYNVLMNSVGTTIGTPGTVMTKDAAADAVLLAAAKLYEAGAPIDDGLMTEINSPTFNALLAGSSMRLFNPQGEIGDIYRKGLQGTYGGFEHFVSQNVGRHVNGTFTGTPLVNGANQTGSSLVTDGWGANSFLNVGDAFTIAGVYSVNPQTYVSTGNLMSFTVTAASVTAGGASTLSISPAIVTDGGYKNVTAAPADNAALTVVGASGVGYNQAIAFHRDALMMASVDLPVPVGVERASYMRDPESGIGIRMVQQYDIRTDAFVTRFDVMIAWASLYPQLAVRIITS